MDAKESLDHVKAETAKLETEFKAEVGTIEKDWPLITVFSVVAFAIGVLLGHLV